jgi:hypothetical protein
MCQADCLSVCLGSIHFVLWWDAQPMGCAFHHNAKNLASLDHLPTLQIYETYPTRQIYMLYFDWQILHSEGFHD